MRAEDGNAAIALVGGMAVVMVMLIGLSDLATFFLARTRAQTAADAAALAAAAELLPGVGTAPAEQARRFAGANGARLLTCDCRPGAGAAEVTVSVPVSLSVGGLTGGSVVRARSRAEISDPAG